MASLNKEHQLLFEDRGYFGETGETHRLVGGKDSIIICHSLGLHLLADDYFSQCRLLVLIGCFHVFHGTEKKDGLFTRRHVKNMLKEFSDNPRGLLKKFHKTCDSPFAPKNEQIIHKKRLVEDLHLLDTNSFHLERLCGIPQVLLLHGVQDRTVPVERSRYIHSRLHNSVLIEIDNGGHGLPFTHPKLCWEHIDKNASVKDTNDQRS